MKLHEKLIHSEPIETFPFDRMSRAMGMVGWRWYLGRTPTGPELQLEASRMLRELHSKWKKEEPVSMGTGGLVVWRDGKVGFEAKGGKTRACQDAWKAA